MPVYMIQAGETGPVKIGVAKQPYRRLRELQVGNSEKLRVLRLFDGGYKEEVQLHAHLAERRINGEWFSFTPEMLTADFGLTSHMPQRKARGASISLFAHQCLAARGGLNWTQRELASAANVDEATISLLETGRTEPSEDDRMALVGAFKTAGVRFFEDSQRVGVCLGKGHGAVLLRRQIELTLSQPARRPRKAA